MAISSTSSVVDYTATGTQTVFSFPYPFDDSAHLRVSTIAASVETVKTEGTDYSVSGEGTGAGTVVFTAAPTAGDTVRIRRILPLTQEAALRTQGAYSPATVERGLDRLTMIAQQLQDGVLVEGGVYDFGLADASAGGVVASGSVTSRTLAERFGMIVDVRDFGAVGDDANDDTAAINLAITQWKTLPKGALLYFPRGEYKITSALVVNTRDRGIAGDGWRTIIRQATAGERVFVLEGANASPDNALGNIRVENLFCYATGITVPCVQVGGRNGASVRAGDGLDQPVTSVHFRNCWFQGGSHGLYWHNAWDSSANGCAWEGAASYAAYIESGGRIVMGPGIQYDIGSGFGFAKHASLAVPEQVTVFGYTTFLAYRSFATINAGKDIRIVQNTGHKLGRHTVLQPDQSGIYIAASADVSKVTVMGNTIRGVSAAEWPTAQKLQYGIHVAGPGPTELVFIGNNCADTNIVKVGDGTTPSGIWESVNAIRIGNVGDDMVRLRNTSSIATYDNGIDLATKTRPLKMRVEEASAPTVTVAGETWMISPRGTVSSMGRAEIVFYHATHGYCRVLLRNKVETEGNAAPANGTWSVGDMCWNTSPVAGGTIGWVCVTAGSPGTWKTFGSIAP